ncbi:hypothetical protein F4780DRAFT_26794 [Xylariomycetidae sp. FL0641]|nr:hypothetical protein F4780DRAFT_26794 [Xylariomycetidae sp. FL0641]
MGAAYILQIKYLAGCFEEAASYLFNIQEIRDLLPTACDEFFGIHPTVHHFMCRLLPSGISVAETGFLFPQLMAVLSFNATDLKADDPLSHAWAEKYNVLKRDIPTYRSRTDIAILGYLFQLVDLVSRDGNIKNGTPHDAKQSPLHRIQKKLFGGVVYLGNGKLVSLPGTITPPSHFIEIGKQSIYNRYQVKRVKCLWEAVKNSSSWDNPAIQRGIWEALVEASASVPGVDEKEHQEKRQACMEGRPRTQEGRDLEAIIRQRATLAEEKGRNSGSSLKKRWDKIKAEVEKRENGEDDDDD